MQHGHLVAFLNAKAHCTPALMRPPDTGGVRIVLSIRSVVELLLRHTRS